MRLSDLGALLAGEPPREREHPPEVGRWVVYQFNGYTAKGVPRFARFVRVREAVEG